MRRLRLSKKEETVNEKEWIEWQREQDTRKKGVGI